MSVCFIVLTAMPGGSLVLSVEAPDELWPAWQRLTASFPLPSGVKAVRQERGAVPIGDRAVLGRGVSPGSKTVGKTALAPVVRLWDSRTTVSLQEARSGSVRVAPLESVALPDIALPVDDLYPDQPRYPLFEDIGLHLESRDRRLRAWFEAIPAKPAGALPPQTQIMWIGAVGDIMPARGVDEALLAPGGLEGVFGDTLPLLRGCNLLLGNLEGAATSAGTQAAKTFTFRFRAAALGRLREAGFGYLSLANNHTFDFGERGFLDSFDNLARWGIRTSGSGRNEAEASRPLSLQVGEGKVCLLSLGAYPVDRRGFDGRRTARAAGEKPGTLWIDDAGLAAVSRASASGAFTVVLVHGGLEWSALPTGEQKRLYRRIVRSGADIVIGSHPHVLQGMEVYENGLIAYSLGNFLFPGMEGTPGGTDSVILRVGVWRGKTRYVQAFAVRLAGPRVRQDQTRSIRLRFLESTRALNEPR